MMDSLPWQMQERHRGTSWCNRVPYRSICGVDREALSTGGLLALGDVVETGKS